MLTPPPGGVMDGELAIARRASRSERPPGVPRLLPLSIFDTATCRSSHSSEGAVGVCSGQANTGYCSRGVAIVSEAATGRLLPRRLDPQLSDVATTKAVVSDAAVGRAHHAYRSSGGLDGIVTAFVLAAPAFSASAWDRSGRSPRHAQRARFWRTARRSQGARHHLPSCSRCPLLTARAAACVLGGA